MSNTIVLTGGGTAGHVSPNINLSDELKKHFNRIVYIGTENGIEKRLISAQTDYEYKTISAVKFVRNKILKNIALPFKLAKSIHEAKVILKEIKPSIVFSKGGYVSLPVVIASHKLGIPVISHESDLTMGLANKIASKYSSVVCTNFEKTAKGKKNFICTGSPIKHSKLSKQEAKSKLGIESSKPVLLVTGGSLGAKSINEVIFSLAPILTKKYFIIHIVGKNNLNKKITLNDYMQIEFSNDMSTIFRATDYAISRAGANSIFELLSNEIPTIFIPLPKDVSRGDQIENAKQVEEQGLAIVLLQNSLNKEKLQNTLEILEKTAKNIVLSIKKQNYCDGSQKIIEQILAYKK